MTLDWRRPSGDDFSDGFTTTSSWPLSWHNPRGVEFVFSRAGTPWGEPRCLVDSVVPQSEGGAHIKMRQPCFKLFTLRGACVCLIVSCWLCTCAMCNVQCAVAACLLTTTDLHTCMYIRT